jgi:hypothetical protein
VVSTTRLTRLSIGTPSSIRAPIGVRSICTRLNALKARRRRLLPHLIAPPACARAPLGAPTHDDQWIEPAPDSLLEVPARNELDPEARVILRETIGLAFIAALQYLSPRQRAGAPAY